VLLTPSKGIVDFRRDYAEDISGSRMWRLNPRHEDHPWNLDSSELLLLAESRMRMSACRPWPDSDRDKAPHWISRPERSIFVRPARESRGLNGPLLRPWLPSRSMPRLPEVAIHTQSDCHAFAQLSSLEESLGAARAHGQ
jgi:hypothetical protein